MLERKSAIKHESGSALEKKKGLPKSIEDFLGKGRVAKQIAV